MSRMSASHCSSGLHRLERLAVVLDTDARAVLGSGRAELDLSVWYRPADGRKQFSADAVWFGCQDPVLRGQGLVYRAGAMNCPAFAAHLGNGAVQAFFGLEPMAAVRLFHAQAYPIYLRDLGLLDAIVQNLRHYVALPAPRRAPLLLAG